ncbi:alpha/beta hydrolase [Dactylosporangium sp. AC04546]|uniref:alpha/beta fold hydrolase n=1 Tax=Dactylosporangium sp. AC04546 TaxID=2862460 RepID=UPI001EDDB880|nr:alpha/beta hydrolase [Dactylosporangium sp. AC04546]WVK87663.1 alpha/beta hydrolase [Dactylosporangium sp. AC04546]
MYSAIAGSGERMLVIVQGGDGDADGAGGLVEAIVARGEHRVLTYDRRGLSRSPVGDGPVTIETHTDDLALLLAKQADGPVDVLGISIGALIALDLAARYPGLVGTVVAHEPPLSQVLDDPAEFVARQESVEEAFRNEGIPAAMRQFLALTRFDPADREDDVVLPAPRPERAANLGFFLTHDAPAARRFRLYLDPLLDEPPQVVPAVGERSAGALHAAPVEALARRLGKEPVRFPGGHSGHVLRPRAFADQLLAVLTTAPTERSSPPGRR